MNSKRKNRILVFSLLVASAEIVYFVISATQSQLLLDASIDESQETPSGIWQLTKSPIERSVRGTFPIFNGNLDRLHDGNFSPDYGHLDIQGFNHSESRRIQFNDSGIYEMNREEQLEIMSQKMEKIQIRKVYADDELEEDPPEGCYRNNWKSKFHPTCNNFHDQDILQSVIDSFLVFRGEATFRAAWSHHTSPQVSEESFSPGDWVIKTIRLNWMNGLPRMVEMQREAVVLEVLSASPRIIDIYGFCGQNSIVENMPHEVEEEIHTDLSRRQVKEIYHRDGTQYPVNNLTSLQLVDLAIIMAESLADVHGFAGGVIVQGDIHGEQWLRNVDGFVKLNDFNNGFIMDWNYANNAYCMEQHGFQGTFFPPEAHLAKKIATEQVDIYGFGSTLYTMMTGNYPYFETVSSKVRYRMIRQGELAPIHNIYKVNGTLESEFVKVILQCWEYNPKSRPSIFEVVNQLKSIKRRLLNKELKLRRRGDRK